MLPWAAVAAWIVVQFAGAAQAQAQDIAQSAVVIPLDNELGPDRADIILPFNLALADVCGRDGAEVTVAQTSLRDTMALVGCDQRSGECLAQVAGALDVDRIVYGQVTEGAGPDIYRITITVARRDPTSDPMVHRFEVRVQDIALAESAFAAAAPKQILDAAPAAFTPLLGSRPDPGQDDSVHEGPLRYDFHLDRVDQGTWLVAGAGAATLAMGLGFWLAAHSSQRDVDSLQVVIPADYDRLISLENRTQTRATVGNVLVGTGLAAMVVGAILVVRQARVETLVNSNQDSPELDVSLIPLGADSVNGAILTVGWPL